MTFLTHDFHETKKERGRNLIKEKRCQCVELHAPILNQRQITRQLLCSRGSIRNALRLHHETGSHSDRPGIGQPR